MTALLDVLLTIILLALLTVSAAVHGNLTIHLGRKPQPRVRTPKEPTP
jgi:hypothetical protein